MKEIQRKLILQWLSRNGFTVHDDADTFVSCVINHVMKHNSQYGGDESGDIPSQMTRFSYWLQHLDLNQLGLRKM
jgi:hypothetical protein